MFKMAFKIVSTIALLFWRATAQDCDWTFVQK
jgi:hypothetical protein